MAGKAVVQDGSHVLGQGAHELDDAFVAFALFDEALQGHRRQLVCSQ